MHDVTLERPGDFAEWRDKARELLAAGVPPEEIGWQHDGDSGSLFCGAGAQKPLAPRRAIALPRTLVALADRVICHRDPATPARLYRILWRAIEDRRLLERRTDDDIVWLTRADKAIRRDLHKMHAFVRFRRLGVNADGREAFAAWFEPEHRIVRLAAPFFRKRFYGMDWAIVTPDARAVWQAEILTLGPGGTRDDLPDHDLVEDQWRTYYGAIFNPARVKIAAMRAEMPKKYWHNLPEAQDIAPLLAGANALVATMRATAVSIPNPRQHKWRARSDPADAKAAISSDPDTGACDNRSLDTLTKTIAACTRCPLHCHATQAVPGEGSPLARILLVGEQPGDREDLQGRPFVGPAGALLDAALAEAGLDRETLFITNAVKHFKFTPRGKRRLHQTPVAGEIDACRWWLDQERALIRPDVIIALGASALRGVLGRSTSVASVRGQPIMLADGARLVATVHPAFLLRLPDPQRAATERAAFVADLRSARLLAD